MLHIIMYSKKMILEETNIAVPYTVSIIITQMAVVKSRPYLIAFTL